MHIGVKFLLSTGSGRTAWLSVPAWANSSPL